MRTNWKILENSKKFKNRFGGDAIITYENEIISVSTKNS